MKTIPLTQGYSALVDDEDYARLSQFTWYAEVAQGGNVYAARKVMQNRLTMANDILLVAGGTVVDHINGDTLNNSRANLRPVTWQQNCMNKGLQKNKVGSKYKGVSYLAGPKHQKRWFARITKNGKTTVLGSFEDELSAARAYNDAATELHGEFARLNSL